eukprot:1286554-Prymnesium_polylepis.1
MTSVRRLLLALSLAAAAADATPTPAAAAVAEGATTSHPERLLAYRMRPAAPPPPWMPGMAPPVPGPVFSKAFNALLVLLVVGCGVLCVQLKTSLDAMKASALGEDNEVLTGGRAGTQAWLRQVQQSKGLAPSLKAHEIAAIDEEAQTFGARKKKGSKAKGDDGRKGGGKKSLKGAGRDEED